MGPWRQRPAPFHFSCFRDFSFSPPPTLTHRRNWFSPLFPQPLIHEETNKFMIWKEFCSSALLRYTLVQNTVFIHARFSRTLPISCNILIFNKFILLHLWLSEISFYTTVRPFMYTNSETRIFFFFWSNAILWFFNQNVHPCPRCPSL